MAETSPIDANDLRPCALCKRGVAHDGSLVFYEMTIASCVFDVGAIQRLHGLEMMMGGNVAIARAFSPDTTIASRIEPSMKHLICSECAMETTIVPLQLLEDPHG